MAQKKEASIPAWWRVAWFTPLWLAQWVNHLDNQKEKANNWLISTTVGRTVVIATAALLLVLILNN